MDTTITDAFALAVGHHQNGRPDQAEHVYRLILTVDPAHPAALNNLGLIAPPGEAIGLFQRAVAAEPGYVDALINLSSALHASGDAAEGAAVFARAVQLVPSDPDSLFRLAHVLHTQGQEEAAATQYERAIRLRPNFGAALCNLGTIHNQAHRIGAAADCYRRALAADPDLAVANLNMVSILQADGRLTEAKQCHDRLARPHPIEVEQAPDHRRTVLIVANACVGNVPLDTLFPTRTNTRITWHADFATAAQVSALPRHDVAFNAIGNADLLDEAFSHVSQFAAGNAVLNHPAAIARTRRDRLPGLLDGIPGLVVPKTVRLTRMQMASQTLAADLQAAGLAAPLLIRPVAGHGGEGVELIETAGQLAGYNPGKADAYYVIAYHDVRQADGCCRKYRTIFVDGRSYPYHLAISEHWLVHYFSAAMATSAWKREEEQRFLSAPETVIGKTATGAIAAVCDRLGLDFAGIDYALLPDGRVLLFEANATMLVHLRDSIADFPYKHDHVPMIFEAFEAMLERHTSPRTLDSTGLACPPLLS